MYVEKTVFRMMNTVFWIQKALRNKIWGMPTITNNIFDCTFTDRMSCEMHVMHEAVFRKWHITHSCVFSFVAKACEIVIDWIIIEVFRCTHETFRNTVVCLNSRIFNVKRFKCTHEKYYFGYESCAEVFFQLSYEKTC